MIYWGQDTQHHHIREHHYSSKEVFLHNGIPDTLVTDNGTGLSKIIWVQSYHIKPSFSTEQQTTGRTNSANSKQLLQDSKDPFLALLCYRTTFFPWCGLSPAELSMGRMICSNLAQVKKLLVPKQDYLNYFQKKNKLFRGWTYTPLRRLITTHHFYIVGNSLIVLSRLGGMQVLVLCLPDEHIQPAVLQK